MIDWQTSLYNPAYREFGVEASFASQAGQSFTVIDHTEGIAIPGVEGSIDTVRPVAFIRAKELSDNSVTLSDLPEDQITFNGQTWRIESFRPVPSRRGEGDGQIMLILTFEP